MKEISGMKVIEYETVESTQKVARGLLAQGINCHRVVIIAREQDGGFGRLNRKWHSPEGGLWLSAIFQKPISIQKLRGYSVKYGIHLADFLKDYIELKVRWPNDLMIDDKKVGGILTEISSIDGKINHLIVGLGLNINISRNDFPEEIANLATSLSEELNKQVDFEEVVQNIIEIHSVLFSILEDKKRTKTSLSNFWQKLSYTYNKQVEINVDDKTILGKEIGITDHGELILELKSGEEEIFSLGEVNLLRKRE
ncbi:MAG: biotin--[acetyl-CoA-carboxylase] ligase [Asgard group archaeon]|nr:biotin--[acetyl-CoA-carboxylase] ligase [Asgard group archaeon]